MKQSKYQQSYYQRNKKRLLKQKKEKYKINRDSILADKKRYYQEHKQEISEYSKEWYKDNCKTVKRRVRTRRFNHPENYILICARASAKKRNLQFSLTIDDIHIPKYCPVLGMKLNIHKGRKNYDDSPSIDRIDNSKGYVSGNVEVISYRANRIKNDASKKEIEKLYKHYCLEQV